MKFVTSKKKNKKKGKHNRGIFSDFLFYQKISDIAQ